MNNILTKYISIALDILFIKQPTRTSLGFVFGMAARTFFKLLSIWVIVFQIVVAKITVLEFGLAGICLAHIPTIWNHYFGTKSYLSENEEKAFSMIRDLKISDTDKQQLYLRVVEKVLENVELKPDMQEEIRTQYG